MLTMEKELKKGHQRGKKMRYMPGLDGLRAIAVIGIIIYHLNKNGLLAVFRSGYILRNFWLFNY